jgi:hypothetical protein
VLLSHTLPREFEQRLHRHSPEVLECFRKQGAGGGRIGGKRSLETITPEERTARAKKASDAAVAARKAKRKKT